MLIFSRLLIAILLCVWNPVAAIAGEPDTTSGAFDILGADLATAGGDALGYFLAPLSFDERQWLYTAGVLGLTATTMATDEESSPWMRRQASPLNDRLASVAKLYGERTYAIAFALSVYTGGLIAGESEVRITGRLLCESLLLAGITSQSIKMLAGRSRPYREEGAWYFDPLQLDDNSRFSFPSGHTVVAFSLSSVLAERIGNVWVGAGLYSLASLTALSRVYDGEHWLSDTILGAAIGTAAGLAVTSFETAREKGGEGYSVMLLPTAQGITVVYRF